MRFMSSCFQKSTERSLQIKLIVMLVALCLYTQINWMFSNQSFQSLWIRLIGGIVIGFLLGYCMAKWWVSALYAKGYLKQRKILERRFFSISILLILPAIVYRGYALLAVDSLVMLEPSLTALIRGFVSDVIIIIFIAWLIAKTNKRMVTILCFCVLSLLFTFDLEHILVNSAHINVYDMRNALGEAFILGTVISVSVFFKLSIIIFISLIATFIFWRVMQIKVFNFVVIHIGSFHISVWRLWFVYIVIWVSVFTPQYSYPNWVYQGITEYNLRTIWTRSLDTTVINDATKDEILTLKNKYYSADLNGQPLLQNTLHRPNILILVLEGIGYGSLLNHMPYLSQFANEHLSYPRFLTQQHQTNRGLFALLCGQYPNLIEKRPKTEHVILSPKQYNCLPKRLKQAGYQTTYLQSANLSYMYKNRFTKIFGFEQSLGHEHFPLTEQANEWGMDDLTLLKRTEDTIVQLNAQKKPWFLTVLSVGTHHPYNVPDRTNASYEDAVAYADSAVAYFIAQLQAKQLSDNLLLIITTDEADGVALVNTPLELGENHGILIVSQQLQPNPLQHQNVFAQSDIFLSILDYLNLNTQNTMGRNIFKQYPMDSRQILFANTYLDRFYALDNKMLSVCSINYECNFYDLTVGLFRSSHLIKHKTTPLHLHNMKILIQINDVTF